MWTFLLNLLPIPEENPLPQSQFPSDTHVQKYPSPLKTSSRCLGLFPSQLDIIIVDGSPQPQSYMVNCIYPTTFVLI